jgi:hypothetical protein
MIPLTQEIKKDLLECANALQTRNHFPFPLEMYNSTILMTDASNLGYGGISSTGTIIGGNWQGPERILHINIQETKTILLMLKKSNIRNTSVIIYTDNQVAMYCLRKGRSNQSINQLVKEIYKLIWETNSIIQDILFIKTDKNTVPDYLSRCDWKVPELVFKALVEKF